MLKEIFKHIAFKEADSQNQILGLFREQYFEKGEYLVKKDQISDKIFFVESGILREYSNLNVDVDVDVEKNDTHWILGENEWVFQVRSFVNNEPSLCNIEVLKKVKAFVLNKTDYIQLMEDYPEILKVVLSLYERYLVQLEERNLLLRIKPAKKRLAIYEEKFPYIAANVPLKIIASFINITPEDLSRIRSSRSKAK